MKHIIYLQSPVAQGSISTWFVCVDALHPSQHFPEMSGQFAVFLV